MVGMSVTPKVVILTTSSASSDANFLKIMSGQQYHAQVGQIAMDNITS